MKMAANSNMSFHHGMIQASTFNRHAIAFQSGAINSSAGMIPVGNSGGFGIIPGGNSAGMSNMAGVIPSGGSGCGLLLDTMPGLKHDGGLAVEWSFDEQSILEEGLAKYADETNFMRYIKIAAALRQKTVRDVALRCRWMTRKENGKRRKPEDHYTGKKMKDRKEKLMDSASKTNIPLAPQNILAYSFMMQHREDNDRNSCEALSGTTRHLLDENDRVFSQIAANLATFKPCCLPSLAMAQQLLCRAARSSFSDDGGRSMQLRIYLGKCKEIPESSVLRWFWFLQRFWVLQASSNNNRTQKSRSSCFFFLSGQGKVTRSNGEGRGCGFQRQPSFIFATESSPTSAAVVLSSSNGWSSPDLPTGQSLKEGEQKI